MDNPALGIDSGFGNNQWAGQASIHSHPTRFHQPTLIRPQGRGVHPNFNQPRYKVSTLTRSVNMNEEEKFEARMIDLAGSGDNPETVIFGMLNAIRMYFESTDVDDIYEIMLDYIRDWADRDGYNKTTINVGKFVKKIDSGEEFEYEEID